MNDKSEFDLLADLAKLMKKHGPQTLDNLAELVSRPNFGEQLASVLKATAKVSTSTLPRQRAEMPTRDFRYSLVKLEMSEPDKSALLVAFYDGVMAKQLLPTLDELNSFASTLQLEPFKRTPRDKATYYLTKKLMTFSLEDLKRAISLAPPTDRNGNDRSMDGWSQLILSKKRTTDPVLAGHQ
jgi:hypothetical protein